MFVLRPCCIRALALACLVLTAPAAAQPQKPTAVEIANRSLAEVGDSPARDAAGHPLQISGIYPHLAAFNGHGECGIGAVASWAGRLWWITYPPHFRQGSNDKLYSTDDSLLLTVQPESVGGTHAARLIHEPSNQLFIGPYAISSDGRVRALDVRAIPGRYTAWATHLTHPDDKLYLVDMEGPVWEVDVHSLAGERLFVKPAPGWHGKGAYTGQDRLVISNNGEASAAGDLPKTWEFPRDQWTTGGDNLGVLAEYDGQHWNIVQRRQFVDITGPRGIRGSFRPDDPVWAMGWDRRSVLLAVCDQGEWRTYRLPKASHAMDPTHGWYTEWPRIRAVGQNLALMCMHGMFYRFPLDFRSGAAAGIRPLASHLRYVPDFCEWNGRIVLASDDASVMQNPLAGQSQSNLWFGTLADFGQWGQGAAFGGVWLGDDVKADVPSDPYLFAGFRGRVLHLAAGGERPVDVVIEVDRQGTGEWETFGALRIPASGYTWRRFDDEETGEWIRFRTGQDVKISAYLHYAAAADRTPPTDDRLFAGLAPNSAPAEPVLIRPAGHNGRLQALAGAAVAGEATKSTGDPRYFEMDGRLTLHAVDDPALRDEALRLLQADAPQVVYDSASAILTTHTGMKLRLPRVSGTTPLGRDVREVQSERSLAHIGNIFYEVPRGELGKHILEYRKMRPISAHTRAIADFCSWRGLLVLSGVRSDAPADGHIFGGEEGGPKLWFGMVDDLWRLGKPVGVGGPWKETAVTAGKPSDPYLMTGFDRKTLELSHNGAEEVAFRLEIDYSNRDFWKPYSTITVPPGQTVRYEFPADYQAHWIRFSTDRDCQATAWLTYE